MSRPRPVEWRVIKDALRSWFSDATDLETIWGDQSAPQAAYPYATITNIGGGPNNLGVRESEEWLPDGTLRYVGQRELVLSCQIHVGGEPTETHDPDEDSRNRMDAAISSLVVPEVIEQFRQAGLALRDRTQPQAINVLVGTEWISRQTAEFRFGFVSVVSAETTPGLALGSTPALDAVGYFDKVEISSDLEGLQDPNSGLELDEEILDPNA